MPQIDLSNASVEQCIAALNSGTKRASQAGRRALRGSGRAAASIVRRRALQIAKSNLGRISGNLRRSFRLQEVRMGGGSFRVVYGNALLANYAVFVELGHDIVRDGRKVGTAKPNRILLQAIEDTQPLVTHTYLSELRTRVTKELQNAAKLGGVGSG